MNIDKLKSLGFSIGIELPLDNDWSSQGQKRRIIDSRSFGIPDISKHKERIILADKLGFSAAWIRDVPLYDQSFGDAAQVFEAFSYLGYLSGITKNILLGTAAIVLPLRQPWLVKKAARTIAKLSDDRLILGVASGDRPSEYPVFGIEYNERGELFRKSVNIIKNDDKTHLPESLDLLPKVNSFPLYAAGLAQQTPEWIGENLDGWLAYPGTPTDHAQRVSLWRKAAGNKPYVSFIHLDLVEDPLAPITRHRFGIKTGINGLIEELNQMKNTGVDHIGLQLRRNERDLESSMDDIGKFVIPHFHS